jgi:hypothetical protein
MIRSIAKTLLSLAVRRRWHRVEGVAIGMLARWHVRQPARDAVQLDADAQLEARLLGLCTDTIDVPAFEYRQTPIRANWCAVTPRGFEVVVDGQVIAINGEPIDLPPAPEPRARIG